MLGPLSSLEYGYISSPLITVPLVSGERERVNGFCCLISSLFPAGEDFEAVDTTLSFPEGSSNGTTACVWVPLIDDYVFEKFEFFTVHIYSVEPNVHVYGHHYVTVNIYDDDG